MQFALSRIMKGTPCRLRPAATARPEGPAPTMTGPFTQMHRREKKSSWSGTWFTIGGMSRVHEVVCCNIILVVIRLKGFFVFWNSGLRNVVNIVRNEKRERIGEKEYVDEEIRL